MYYRSQKPPYQKYVLYAVVIVTVVALMIFGGNALRTELEQAQATVADPDQNTSSNYNAMENSSQEDRESSSYAANAGSSSENAESSRERESSSSASSSRDRDASGTSSKPEDEDSDVELDEEEYYTVTAYGGNIAVFRNDEKDPLTVLDVPVTYFPEEDQKLLEEGIRVTTLAEAMQLLEDYH